MKVRAGFTPEAARLIARLSPEVKRLVRSAIDQLREDPLAGSELSAELQGYRSYNVRRYRVIYRLRGSYLEGPMGSPFEFVRFGVEPLY